MWLSSRSVKGVHTQYYEQPLRSYYLYAIEIHYSIDNTKLIDRMHGYTTQLQTIWYDIPERI